MILIKTKIEQISEGHFIGRIEKMKGMIAEADSIENVKRELLTSFKVKLAFDYGLSLTEM